MLLLSESAVEVSSKRLKYARLITILLFGMVSMTEGSEPGTQPPEPSKAVSHRRAVVEEIRRDSENVKKLLRSNASPEEKQKAVNAFRAKREASRAAMLADIPERTPEEKAILRQRMKERIREFPEERRKIMEERLVIAEEMEKLRSEQKRLSPEERQTRMQELRERRRQMMESQMAAMEAAAALEAKEKSKVPRSPFQQAIAAEREKLDAAISSGDPDARRAAVESFRAAVQNARQARLQEMEQRLGPDLPPPPEPSQSPVR